MTSRIEAGMTIEGSIRGEGELEVAGRVRGALTIDGKLVIEVGGIVEADVEATDIEVAGLLSGSATAHNTVQVLAGGRMEARVKAPRLLVDDGALFRGELQAQIPDEDPTLQRSPAMRRALPRATGASSAAAPKASPTRPATRSEASSDRTEPANASYDRTISQHQFPPRTGGRSARPAAEPPASKVRGRAPGFSVPGRAEASAPVENKARGVAPQTAAVPAKQPAEARGSAPPKMPGLPKGRTAIARRGDGT